MKRADFIGRISGIDAWSNPTYPTESKIVYSSINRTFRAGYNKTRPAYFHCNASFDSQEDMDYVSKRAIHGVFGYNEYRKGLSPKLIVVVGSRVYAASVGGYRLGFKKIYDGLTPARAFAVKAEQYIVIQNGINLPIYWDGAMPKAELCSSVKSVSADENFKEFPIGTFMVYAHGRIFVLVGNTVYASNHIYSNGLINTSGGIMNFSESTYPFAGDGFGTPGDLGSVTGLSILKQSEQVNGHGPVVVMCERGAYGIAAQIDRQDWTSAREIQTIVLTGTGAVSQPLGVNNDIVFRSSRNELVFFRRKFRDERGGAIGLDSSVGVRKFLEVDPPGLAQLVNMFEFDGRIFCPISIESSKSSEDGEFHTYANGLVVGDTLSNIGQEVISWEGIWTGPRVIGSAAVDNGIVSSMYVASHDLDGTNRFYAMTNIEGDDNLHGGKSRIASSFSFNAFLQDVNSNVRVKVDHARVIFSGAQGRPSIGVSLTPESYSHLLYKLEAVDEVPQETPVDSSSGVAGLQYGSFLFSEANPDSYDSEVTNPSGNSARYFGVTINISGATAIDYAILSGVSVSTGDEMNTIIYNSKSSPLAESVKTTFSYQF